MEKIAVFPGSFDPITIGHESIVRRAFPLFDKIIIAIGINTNKEDYFPLEKRMEWISRVFEDNKNVTVDNYIGLTVDFCKKVNARFLLRGLRTSADFEYERSIAQMNKAMAPEIESVFILTEPQYTSFKSVVVRDIIRHGGDASSFLPEKIKLSELYEKE